MPVSSVMSSVRLSLAAVLLLAGLALEVAARSGGNGGDSAASGPSVRDVTHEVLDLHNKLRNTHSSKRLSLDAGVSRVI